MKYCVRSMKAHSPVFDAEIIEDTSKCLDFNGAISAILDGKRVSRKEWEDIRWYCLLQDDMLQIHKPGEKEGDLHPWIINNGDLGGFDWFVL